MKKLIFCLVALIPIGLWATNDNFVVYSVIGPTVATSSVTIPSPGVGKRNCLTDLTIIGNANYTFRILDGGTTNFTLVLASGTGFTKEWDRNDPRCSTNTAVSTTLSIDTGTFQINYQGFVR